MKPLVGNGFQRECVLVKYGEKFHPVNKYAVDLADMMPSHKEKCLKSHRKWYLKVEGLYRDFVEKDAQKKNYQLSLEVRINSGYRFIAEINVGISGLIIYYNIEE